MAAAGTGTGTVYRSHWVARGVKPTACLEGRRPTTPPTTSTSQAAAISDNDRETLKRKVVSNPTDDTRLSGAEAQLDAMTPKVKAAHKTGVKIPGLNKALFNSARVIISPMCTKQDIRATCLKNKVRYDSPSETSGDDSVFNSFLNVEKGRKRGPRREDPSIVRNLTFELDNVEVDGIVTEIVDEKVSSSLSVNHKQETIPTRKANKTRAPSSSESQKNTELLSSASSSKQRSHSAHHQKANVSSNEDDDSRKNSEERAQNQKTSNCPQPPSDSGDHQGRNTKKLKSNHRKPLSCHDSEFSESHSKQGNFSGKILSDVLKKPTRLERVEKIGSKKEGFLEKETRTRTTVQETQVRNEPRKLSDVPVSQESEDEPVMRRVASTKTGIAAPERRILPFRRARSVGCLVEYEQITRKMQMTAANTVKVQKNNKSLSQDSEQERTSRNKSRQTAKTQKIQKTAEEQIGLEEYKDSEDEKMSSRKVSSQWTNAQKKQATTQPAPDRTQSACLSKIKTTPAEFNSERDVSPGRDSRQSGNRKQQPPSDIASSGSPGPSPSYQEQQRKANKEDSQPASASPQKKSPESRLSFLVESLSNSSSEDEANDSWLERILSRYTKRATPRSKPHPGTSQEPESEFEKLQGKPIIPQKNSKKLKPNLHGVSSTEFSSSKEDQKAAAAGKKKPKATKTMSRNVNSQDDQPQRAVLAANAQARILSGRGQGRGKPLRRRVL